MALSKIPNYLQDTIDSDAIGASAIGAAKLADIVDLSGKTLTLPGGHIIQTVVFQPSASTDNFSVSANTDVVWFSTTFTTKQSNSKILISYHSGQINANYTNADVNPRLEWSLDSTTRRANMDYVREHNHEWFNSMGTNNDKRLFISGSALSSTLSSAGNHTIRAFAGTYNRDLVFQHQGDSNPPLRRPIFVFQELTT